MTSEVILNLLIPAKVFSTKNLFLLIFVLELLKNSMIQINKTASNVHFNEVETDRELIFQQLYFLLFVQW